MAKVKRHLFAKTFLPIGWIGGEYEEVKTNNKTIVTTLKSILAKETPAMEESFDQAMERLGLTSEEVASIANKYRLYAYLFLFMGTLLFCYAFYLLFAYFSLTGWMLALAATCFCLAQAFRYDFWSYQMRERKLGLTFQEWKKRLLS